MSRYTDLVMSQRPMLLFPLWRSSTAGSTSTPELVSRTRTGTADGTRVTAAPSGPGISERGTSFSSFGEYTGIPDALWPSITGDLTLSVLLRLSLTTYDLDHVVGAYTSGGSFAGWSAAVGNGGNRLAMFWHGSGGWKSSGYQIPANVWLHATWRLTGTTFEFLHDGAVVGSIAAGVPSAYAGTKAIAARSDGAAELDADMQHLAIWNRSVSNAELRRQVAIFRGLDRTADRRRLAA